MNTVSKDFTPLYATTHATTTLLLRLAFILFSLLFIVPLYLAPIGLFLEEIYTAQFGICYVLYTITLTYLIYKFIKYIQKSNTKSVSTISVDREGLHYTFLDKTTEDILFSELGSYKQLYTPDVTSYTKGVGVSSKTVLAINHKQTKREIGFQITALFSNSYITNSSALRARFIQGVVVFRPDLTIDQSVYTNFYIDPNTFTNDRKAQNKVLILSIVMVALILFIIYSLI